MAMQTFDNHEQPQQRGSPEDDHSSGVMGGTFQETAVSAAFTNSVNEGDEAFEHLRLLLLPAGVDVFKLQT